MERYGASIAMFVGQLVVAALAGWHFADRARLPMQWSLSGTIAWTAPRGFALGFFPVLSLILAVFAFWADHASAPGGANRLAIGVAIVTGVQLLHVGLLLRTTG